MGSFAGGVASTTTGVVTKPAMGVVMWLLGWTQTILYTGCGLYAAQGIWEWIYPRTDAEKEDSGNLSPRKVATQSPLKTGRDLLAIYKKRVDGALKRAFDAARNPENHKKIKGSVGNAAQYVKDGIESGKFKRWLLEKHQRHVAPLALSWFQKAKKRLAAYWNDLNKSDEGSQSFTEWVDAQNFSELLAEYTTRNPLGNKRQPHLPEPMERE